MCDESAEDSKLVLTGKALHLKLRVVKSTAVLLHLLTTCKEVGTLRTKVQQEVKYLRGTGDKYKVKIEEAKVLHKAINTEVVAALAMRKKVT